MTEADGPGGTPTFGGFRLSDRRGCLVDAAGAEVALPPRALATFRALAARPGAVIGREALLAEVWGHVHVTDDALGKSVGEIRRAIGDGAHRTLRTVPRRGYRLMPDPPASDVAEHDPAVPDGRPGTRGVRWPSFGAPVGPFAILCATLLAVAALVGGDARRADRAADAGDAADAPPAAGPIVAMRGGAQASAAGVDPGATPIAVDVAPHAERARAALVDDLAAELGSVLGRYASVRLDEAAPEYRLTLRALGGAGDVPRVAAELLEGATGASVFAETYPVVARPELFPDAPAARATAVRLAAAIASPGVGAVGRHLLARSRATPVEALAPAECYANGFGCAKCSGEEDNVTPRAEACLARRLAEDPGDARAWALQATIHAHQYWWGNTLAEPLRGDPKLRAHLPAKAIAAANRAEALSDGTDSAVYWGMAEAYFAACEPDKLATAVERGLAINPDDPNLLAAFGNWTSYAGRWEEGAALVRRALAIEPTRYRHWWWMGLAKTHYFERDFAAAHRAFMKAFNERNWVSHLQLAYTLPHLGRLEEAREAVRRLRFLYGGMTVERALEHYELLCFPDSFLADMRTALVAAGLPSRGDASDLDAIEMPRPTVIEVNGFDLEYVDEGEGEPVVFVHGAISDHRTWGFYLAPISERHRYVSYSQRYFGTQPWADEGERFGTGDQADDLVAFVEALDTGPVHLVSWSSGVQAALVATVRRPELFLSAVHYEPVEPNVLEGLEGAAELLDEWRARWAGFGAALEAGDAELAAEHMVEIVFELPPGGYHDERETHQEIVRQNARTLTLWPERYSPPLTCGYAGRVAVPTLIVVGGESHDFFGRMSHRFADCIPDAELATLEGFNHRGAIEAIDELATLITGFVDRHALPDRP